MKKVICVLMAVVLALSLCTGCVDTLWDLAGSTMKSYSSDDLTLEMPANMIDMSGDEFPDYDLVYANDEFGFFLLKEERSELAGYGEDLDAQGYAELMVEVSREVSDGEPVLSQSAAGNPVITYEATIDGETFSYYTVLLADEEAYFAAQFYCERDKYEELLEAFQTCEASIQMK